MPMDNELDNDENMTVELTLDDDSTVTCKIITILTVNEKDYIALLPELETESEEDEVWFYEYSENEKDPNEDPVLTYIEDDDVYESVVDAFDEFLDNCDFDDMP